MQDTVYSDSYLKDILSSVRTVTLVGASNKSNRPSYHVMKCMQKNGYRVIPVNPALVGTLILGEAVYGSLADVPAPYDMVNIFRNSEAAEAVVNEVVRIATIKGITAVWMQLGVYNTAALTLATAAGLKVVMDRCLKIELERLALAR